MTKKSRFNTLLVPTDFSTASREAFDWALDYIEGDDSVIIVLHVIDKALIDLMTAHEFENVDDAVARMREHAQQQLLEYRAPNENDPQIDTMVSVGVPFLEIIGKAKDFVVDAIVMAKVGSRGHFEKLLFGSTAEKVLRGSRRPVIVLPASEEND